MCDMSKSDTLDPLRVNPNTEKLLPKREKPLKDKDEPMCKKSSTEIDDPSRAQLRSDRAEAHSTASYIDNLAPNLRVPKRESMEPSPTYDLKDTEEPIWTMSSTEREEPSLA